MNIAKIPSYPIRMPLDIRRWYEREAIENGRSLNSELVKVLTETKNRKEGARNKEVRNKKPQCTNTEVSNSTTD